MKLATWNVNSLAVRLPQVLDWLARQQQAMQDLLQKVVNIESGSRNEAGVTAVAQAQAATPFDVVLMDVQMPVMAPRVMDLSAPIGSS